MVGAEHTDPGAELGSSQRNHVLPNVGCDHLTVLRRRVVQDPLDEVVAVLVTGDVNKRDAGSITTTLANSVEVSAQEVSATDFEALLYHFGGKLVGAVLSRVANDMVDGSATIRRAAVLTDVLNAPVSKLAMCDDVDVGENLFNAGALFGSEVSDVFEMWTTCFIPCRPPSSSQRYSERQDCPSLPMQLRATCLGGPRSRTS